MRCGGGHAGDDLTATLRGDIVDNNEILQDRYAASSGDAALAAEMEALGSDYHANGYMTRAQADEIGDDLGVGPGQLLLDVGSGCGWPGLYLAERHGCSVVSLDPVAEGCSVADLRSTADGLSQRSWSIQASADAIPIRSRCVDGIVQGDVLC